MPEDLKNSRWLRTLGLFLGQFALTLLLVEGALRLLRPHHQGLATLLYVPSHQTEFDGVETLPELLAETTLGFVPHRIRRGFILNSRSFRTAEYTAPKAPGTYRIMILGDSFTFASGGVPYRQMWTSQLEERLNNTARDDRVEVFALGVPGVGPRFQLRLWELEHDLVQPDLVLVAFFVGNDFTDEKEHSLEPWAETLPIRVSYTARLLRNLYRLWQERDQIEEWRLQTPEDAKQERGGVDVGMRPDQIGPNHSRPQRYLALESHRIQICVRAQRAEFERLAQDAGAVLRRFAAEVEAAGADFLVMIIPDEYQVNRRLRQKVLARLQLSPDDVDRDLPQRWLTAYLEEAGVDYLDLLPHFRRHARRERTYWPNNSHWNPGGNALAGKVLAEHLSGRD